MKEIRSIQDAELRVQPESRKIEGYAILFNSLSEDLGGFRETISPTALDGVLEKSDVLALFNHDGGKVLARNKMGKGTLDLQVDQRGLKYSFNAPKTALGDETLDAIRRGDLANSSFAFTVAKDNGEKWLRNGENYTRTIEKFDRIFDVSPVFSPAYADTSVAARSLSEIKEERVIPEPSDQTESEYMGECVSFLIGEGMDNDQAVAICMDKWSNRSEREIKIEIKIEEEMIENTPDEVTPEETPVEQEPIMEQPQEQPIDEQTETPVMEEEVEEAPIEDTPAESVDAESVSVSFEGNTYKIPKDVLEQYKVEETPIEEDNNVLSKEEAERELKLYISEKRNIVNQLKK